MQIHIYGVNQMNERKMASIRRIDAVNDIPDADAIQVATVGGWKVVIKKNEFDVGTLAIYCEIDSWIPNDVAPYLSKGKEPRVYNGIKGEKLRTVKLRGQVSQGLLLPLSVLGEPHEIFPIGNGCIGADVSNELGIVKYEPPIPAQLAGEMKGSFPSRIPKTDQERIQNLSMDLAVWKLKGYTWEVTEKLEGSSMTVYLIDDDFGVCSRNMDLKYNENNTYWKTAIAAGLEDKLRNHGKNIAIQGELVGEGIQGNIYKLKGHHFYVYDIFDVDTSRYYRPNERRNLTLRLELNHVPVLQRAATLGTMEEIISHADGRSVMGDITGPMREGEVYKCNEDEESFKAISNLYILKSKND